MDWYTELSDLVEQRLVYANVANVGSAFGPEIALPAVEPWVHGSYKPDEQVAQPGQIGDLRKVMLGVDITVAKNVGDGAKRQISNLMHQVETALKTWLLPVTGIIRTGSNRRLDAPQLVFEKSEIQEFKLDGNSKAVVIFSCHLYVDQFEVKQ